MTSRSLVTTAVTVVLVIGYLGGTALWPFSKPDPHPTAAVTEPTTAPIPSPTPALPRPEPSPANAPTPDVPPAEPTPRATPTPRPPVTPRARDQASLPENNSHDSVVTWVRAFGTAHDTGDLAHLLGTLHPVVGESYGQTTCDIYLETTMGSITDLVVIAVDDPAPYHYAAPGGGVTFGDAVGVEANLRISKTGQISTIFFHLIPTGDDYRWLTTCGEKPPTTA